MLEYVFFDKGIRRKFADFLAENKVDYRLNDEDDACLAEVPEDLDDELGDAIDHCYEMLLQETAELLRAPRMGWRRTLPVFRLRWPTAPPARFVLSPIYWLGY
jgi:hypothetical protein